MHDNTETKLLTALCALGTIGLFAMVYFPPKTPETFQLSFTVLSTMVGGAYAALYRAMGVNGTARPDNSMGPKLPGT